MPPNIMFRKKAQSSLTCIPGDEVGSLWELSPANDFERRASRQTNYLYEVVICTWDC